MEHPVKTALRLERKKQKTFAHEVGIAQETLSRILSGRQVPGKKLKKRITSALWWVLPDDLFPTNGDGR